MLANWNNEALNLLPEFYRNHYQRHVIANEIMVENIMKFLVDLLGPDRTIKEEDIFRMIFIVQTRAIGWKSSDDLVTEDNCALLPLFDFLNTRSGQNCEWRETGPGLNLLLNTKFYKKKYRYTMYCTHALYIDLNFSTLGLELHLL